MLNQLLVYSAVTVDSVHSAVSKVGLKEVKRPIEPPLTITWRIVNLIAKNLV